MIYLVTSKQELFHNELYTIITVEESLSIMTPWQVIQFDSETNGRDAHINELLCMQFGNDEADVQIVVDAQTVSPLYYKDILESKLIVGHNLKFDLQFLYNYGIIPRNVYDTMIVEQLIYLGYPYIVMLPERYRSKGYDFPYEEIVTDDTVYYGLSFSLKSVAMKRLGINIDKTVRGQIIYRGLDSAVILYAAGDVMHLQKIMRSQIAEYKKLNLVKAAKLECLTVPSIAYMEWCGILLDETKWKAKMTNDSKMLKEAKKNLDNFVISNPKYAKYTHLDLQGDLFLGFDTEPKCTINWDSNRQVTEFVKLLGFDTTVKDKDTGDDKDSVLEKHIAKQKGINDEFLKIYFDYKEHAKVCSTYGQGHLNMINPNTGRIHTTFKQFGAASGRFSCGSNKPNTDLAKAKGIPPSECKYCNLQQLPADHPTRSSFVAPEGYMFVSADFSSEESRLGADIYQDKAFLKEFTEGSKDTHNMFAWIVYHDECVALGCKDATDVKKLAPQWRKKVKGYEFGYMFGAAAPTLAETAGSTVEEAQAVVDKLDKAFTGMTEFAKRGSRFVRENGYIVMCEKTGHRMNWWDYREWLERQKSFTPEFWEEYRTYHKGTGDEIATKVRKHFQAASKWDRLARNSVTQGEPLP